MQVFIKKSLLVLLLFVSMLNASTLRNDIKLLEASEDIKFIAQSIVKDYLYLSINPQKEEAIKNLNLAVEKLDEKLRLISTITNSSDTKNILNFIAFSRDEISETLSQPYSMENGSLMLDYSEVLLEGSESIANDYSYKFSTEEKMIINIKKMAYLIERITKYYMAIQAQFNDHNNMQQLELSIKIFDEELLKLDSYNYGEKSSQDLAVLKHNWSITKSFYRSVKERKLTNITYISAQNLENLISKLEYFHTQNQ